MDNESQIEIPASFMAIFLTQGRIKPNASREVIAARYDLCEDMASQLVEYAKNTHFDLGVCEDEILRRCHRGLSTEASGLSAPEATWVVRRLAELIGWEDPELADPN